MLFNFRKCSMYLFHFSVEHTRSEYDLKWSPPIRAIRNYPNVQTHLPKAADFGQLQVPKITITNEHLLQQPNAINLQRSCHGDRKQMPSDVITLRSMGKYFEFRREVCWVGFWGLLANCTHKESLTKDKWCRLLNSQGLGIQWNLNMVESGCHLYYLY